jgi:hypothetical protein
VALVAYGLGGLACLTIAAGIAQGIFVALGGWRGEPTETSDRARNLAEGISEMLNCAALGLLVAGLCAVWIVFWKVLMRWRTRRRPPP